MQQNFNMGQNSSSSHTASHSKHFRSDYKTSSVHHQHQTGVSSVSGGVQSANSAYSSQPGIDYGHYHGDELIEDEGISCPTINSRNSYVIPTNYTELVLT